MEEHLEGCAACRRELDQLRGDAALLLLSAADAKPSRTREAEASCRRSLPSPAEGRVPPHARRSGADCLGRRLAPWPSSRSRFGSET